MQGEQGKEVILPLPKNFNINNHRLNMPETIENMFNVLFDDESWSWSGLATILVKRFGIVDLGELDAAIKMELKIKEEIE